MKELARKIETTALEKEFSGVVSIYRDTATIFNRAYGFRDVKDQLPNDTCTLFGIASGTKIFTALGIGVLIDQDLISLETTVEEIDPASQGFIDGKATILQLLTHTSGIYDYYDEEIEDDFDHFTTAIPWPELETPSDYRPLFEGKQMKFPPGERFSYSNGGYVFLGILIEKLTGDIFREFIAEHVLQPAGMKRSGFYAFNDLPANTAHGYLEDRKTTNIYQLPLRGGGDGGMYTTTEDLMVFWESLFANRILSADLKETFLAAHVTRSSDAGYGCGVYKQLDNSSFSIGGVDAGVGFFSRFVVEEKLTVNILSNITNGGEAIREIFAEIL